MLEKRDGERQNVRWPFQISRKKRLREERTPLDTNFSSPRDLLELAARSARNEVNQSRSGRVWRIPKGSGENTREEER